jgi:DNA-binding NarL/FixJ family response regulator
MNNRRKNDKIGLAKVSVEAVKMKTARLVPQEHQVKDDILVLIVAKPGRIRTGLQALLQIKPRLKVAGVTNHSFAAMQMLAQYKPALVLLDLDLPDNQAWVLLKQMQLKQLQTRSLVFANSIEQQRAARSVGASATLLTGFKVQELFTTIEKLIPSYSHS